MFFTTKIPSVVPRADLKPCCWSRSCSSYHAFNLFMMITINILHNEEPICKPRYVLGSLALPFDGPFHSVTSFECPQLLGQVPVSHIFPYSLTIFALNSSQSSACFMKADGTSLADFSSFNSLMTSMISFYDFLLIWWSRIDNIGCNSLLFKKHRCII